MDVGYYWETKNRVVSFPFCKPRISFIDLRKDEVCLVRSEVLIPEQMVIDLPPRYGRGHVQEVYRLTLVAVKILKSKVMLALCKPLGGYLGDRAVCPVVVIQELAINIQLGAIVSRSLEGIVLFFPDFQGGFHQECIVVQGFVDVHQVEIVLDSYNVRISQLGEIWQLPLRPVKIQLVVHHWSLLCGTGGEDQ